MIGTKAVFDLIPATAKTYLCMYNGNEKISRGGSLNSLYKLERQELDER